MEKSKAFDLYLVEEADGRNVAVRAPYLAGREGMFACYFARESARVGRILLRIPTYSNDVLTQILFAASKVYDAYMVFEPSWVRDEENI